MSNYTIIAVRMDGSHDVHTNLEDRAALERRHDGLTQAGYGCWDILVIETKTEDGRQTTNVYTRFGTNEVLIKTYKAMGI
jgi:hypothetical protein